MQNTNLEENALEDKGPINHGNAPNFSYKCMENSLFLGSFRNLPLLEVMMESIL